MSLFENPDVWAVTYEGDTLVARTDLDLSADYPEDDDRASMIHRAAQAELRQRAYAHVFVIDRQPRRWGGAKSQFTRSAAR